MPVTHDFPAMTAPFTLAGKSLRNRLVHASMTTRMQDRGRVSDSLIQYHVNRAEGGVAVTIAEPLAMTRTQDRQPKVQVRDPEAHDGLKRWADAVESRDCRLLGQVQDPGRGRHYPGRSPHAIGASYLPDDLSWTVPHALLKDEIRTLIADFAESSGVLKACGFSGIEISAGHGHLFHQFFSPHSNTREDEYGGDWEGRARLVAELMSAIRETCGSDFIIGLKLPGDDGVPGAIGPEEAAIIASLLTRTGNADYVCFAQGSHARSLEMHLPDRFGPPVPYMKLTRALRPHCNGVPLMALGRITDPAEAESIVAEGQADLVALGRTLIADPAWPKKALQGRTHDIRYCLSCNTCWGYGTMHHSKIRCVNNPLVAEKEEVDFAPSIAENRKRVTVVGAGPAGLEAAWVAAARGHEVTVFCASREVGGKARLRSLLPGGETITSVFDYQYAAAVRAGVRFEFGVRATAADVLATAPDAVIMAAGASMIPPAWVPAEVLAEGYVSDLQAALQDALKVTGAQPGTAVIYDMDHSDAVYAAAEFLNEIFERTVIITPRDGIAEDMWLVARQGIIRRLYERHIDVLRLVEPEWTSALEDRGALEYRNVYNGDTGAIENVAFLAYATPRAPHMEIVASLQETGLPLHFVGDCRNPQDLLFATSEGHWAGRNV